jgi:outer membrane protein
MSRQFIRPFMGPFSGAVLAACATLAAVPAQAQQSVLNLGVSRVDIHSKTTGLQGIGVPPGADLEVQDATTLFLSYEYRFTPNWGVELAAGIPPTHDTKATGSIAFLGKVSSVKQLAPTLFVNYHFGDDSAAWRPFVGLGVNYTRFYDAKSEYNQNIELSDSVGLAAQAGVSYALTPQVSINGAVGVAKVKSDLVATGTTVQTTTIDFRPVVYTLSVGYKF